MNNNEKPQTATVIFEQRDADTGEWVEKSRTQVVPDASPLTTMARLHRLNAEAAAKKKNA